MKRRRNTEALPLEERMALCNMAINLHREKGWGNTRVAKELGISEDTVSGWLYRKRKPNSWYKTPNLVPSKSLSYLIGVYWGDGSASKSKNRGRKGGWYYDIALNVKDRDFVEEFRKHLAEILPRESDYPIGSPPSAKGKYVIKTRSKLLYEFLKRSFDVHESVIEVFPSEFLRGFFDSEGNVAPHFFQNKAGSVDAYNTNHGLLEYVRGLLSRHFSICSVIRIKRRSVGKWSDVYRLSIERHNDILKFNDKIGFSIVRKQKKLVEIARWIRARPSP